MGLGINWGVCTSDVQLILIGRLKLHKKMITSGKYFQKLKILAFKMAAILVFKILTTLVLKMAATLVLKMAATLVFKC